METVSEGLSMKDDAATDVHCPIAGCDTVLHPRKTRTRYTYRSARMVRRTALREHLNRKHLFLTPRQITLILDAIDWDGSGITSTAEVDPTGK